MKKTLLKKLRGFLLFALLLTVSATWAQMEIPSLGTAVTQNFNSMSTSTLPTGFTVGGSASVTYSASSLNSSSGGGSYKFTTGTDNAIGMLNSGSYTTGKTIVLTVKNTTGATVNNLTIGWNYEKYRTGSRAWTFSFSGGSAGDQAYAADGDNATTYFPPQQIAKTVTVTGLSLANNATYTFTWTLTGSGGSSNGQALGIDDVTVTATTNSSTSSTIVRNTTFAEPQNVDYSLYQADNITTANSVAVGSFDIVDGGGTNDADTNATTLTAISFTLQNFANIKRLALYDGTTEKAEIAVTAATATFTGLTSLSAPDNGSKNFTLRATYKSAVTDNQQVRFTVASATAATSSSSTFAAANAGGAATSISGDANRIEVTADRYIFLQQPTNTQVDAPMTPAVTINAKDGLGNLDLDYTAAVNLTSTGILNNSPLSINAVAGLATFSGITHGSAGNALTLTAANTDNTWNTTSGTFNINPYTLTVDNLVAESKTYNGNTTATISHSGLTGIQNSQDVSIVSYIANFDTKNAGANKPVSVTITLGGADAGKYILAPISGITGTIVPKEVTVTGITVNDKDYDATLGATLSGTPVVDGAIAGDDVTVNSTAAYAEFTLLGPGTNIPVTVSGYTLNGTDAANYTLNQPTGITGNINDTGLQNQFITFNPINAVTYGDPTFLLNATASSGLTVTYVSSDENVATISGNTVTITGAGTVTITAAQGGDTTHNPAVDVNQVLVVNQKTLTVSNIMVNNKVYDGTATAAVTGTPVGVVGTDQIILTATGTFDTKNVGENKTVTTVFSLSGADASNYILQQPDVSTGNITPLEVTLNNATAQNKTYDGTENATITATLVGLISGDEVSFSGTGAFASADVANNITVTSTATLTGTDKDNYIISQPTGLSANITPASITIAAEALSKQYDGTITANVQNAYIASGIIAQDDVTLAETTVPGTFNTSAVGTNKPVTASFTLTGADAANYSITPQTYNADITQALLTADISLATVITKTYDSTTTAQVNGVVLTGVVTGETVTAVGGTFASANAGTAIPVIIVLGGADAVNYTLVQPETAITGTITKKGLTATADNKLKNQGTANPALTITYNGFIAGQTAANAAGFTAPVATTTATTASATGMYPITLSGGAATNYDFTALTDGWLSILPAGGAVNLLAWDFTGEAMLPTSDAEVRNSNLDSSVTLTRGSGAGIAAGANSFRTTGFQNNGIALSNTDYFQFVASSATNYVMSLSTIDASFRGTASFGNSVTHQFAYSLNGTNFTFIGNPIVTTTGEYATLSIDISGISELQNVPAGTTVTFRYFASGNTSTGGWGFYSSATGNYGLAVKGIVSPAPTAPVITSTLTDSSDILSTDTYQIVASGTPAVAFTATNLPVGATVDANGLIAFDGTTPAGTYNIILNAVSYYGSNTKTLVYKVNKLNQVLTFNPDPIPVQFTGDAPFLLEVSNTAGLPVSWSSSDENVVTITQDGTITIIGAGTATITVTNTGNDIYNPVTETRTITVGNPCFEWIGTADSNWTNPANWCGGNVPTIGRDVTIAVADNAPVVSASVAYAHNLNINDGASLTVLTGATLYVDNILTVSTNGTLAIQDNGALVQGENTTSNNNSGNITLTKKSNPMFRLDYIIWSSPVAGQNMHIFSPNTSENRFYHFNTVQNAYSGLTATSSEFETGKGYLIRMPNADIAPGYNTGGAAIQYNGIFTGVPNNGNINVTLNNTGNRYNAVGNPYPSPISITGFFAANADAMDLSSGIYLWKKRNNGNNSSYATITLAAYAANPAEGGGSDLEHFFEGDNADWTLAPGQGFLVRALSGPSNPQLHFTNAMRKPTPGASQAFFRQASRATNRVSRLWVNITSVTGTASQAAIAYMDEATLNLDYGYDGKKFNESSTLSLYSIADQTPLAVQARPAFTASDVVLMGCVIPTSGSYTITLDHAQGVFTQGQNIYLKDNYTNTLTNLNEGNYTFVSEEGTFENRFEIVYTDEVLGTDNPVMKADNVIVYQQDKTIFVNAGNVTINALNIYDIRGRKLYTKNNINNPETTITTLTAEQQVLIIEVTTANGKVSKRIVF